MQTGDPFDPTLIVFAVLAAFVIWKLRSVLGVRVDREDASRAPRFEPTRPSPAGRAPLPGAAPADAGPIPPQPSAERWAGVAQKDGSAWSGLDAIAASDRNFDARAFLDGARRAYEMIVTAFARGDRDTLLPLLSKEVFDGFAAEIARREDEGATMETAVVAIDSAKVEAARAAAGQNDITVRFEVRLNSVTRNKAGETIDGGHTTRVAELWTFAREPAASDPNWKLVGTKTVG